MARHAMVMVDPSLVADICRKDWKAPNEEGELVQCIEGVPAEAKYVRSFYHVVRDCFCIVFEHPSFAEIDFGDEYPIVDVVLQRVRIS